MDIIIRQARPEDLAACSAVPPAGGVRRGGACLTHDQGGRLGHYYDIAARIARSDVHFLIAECGSDGRLRVCAGLKLRSTT